MTEKQPLHCCGCFVNFRGKYAARIVMISGACGTGKSSIARVLAEKSTYDCVVHLHTDDFYQHIRKGYIAPWLDDSGGQNETVVGFSKCKKVSENAELIQKYLQEGAFRIS